MLAFEFLDDVVFGLALVYAVVLCCDMILTSWSSGRRRLRIVVPNNIVVALLCGFVAEAVTGRVPAEALWSHIGVALVCLVVFFVFVVRGAVGPGFCKGVTAAMLYLGPDTGASAGLAFCLTIGLGALVAIVGARFVGGKGDAPRSNRGAS